MLRSFWFATVLLSVLLSACNTNTPAPVATPTLTDPVSAPTQLRCITASPDHRILLAIYTTPGLQLVNQATVACQNKPSSDWTMEPIDRSMDGYLPICDGVIDPQSFVRVWSTADSYPTSLAYDMCASRTFSSVTYRQPR